MRTVLANGVRLVALAGALTAPVLVALGVASPARTAAVLVLFCLAPGAAALSLAGRQAAPAEIGLVVAISFAATVVLAEAMVVLGAWHPTAATYVASAACAVPIGYRLLRAGA